jgi:transcriptional regulator with XRE-family HTH domain
LVAFSGSRLVAARVAAGLTQERLAEILGTEQTRVSEWERGATTPRPALIPELAAAVGLDALAFLGADPASPSLEDMRMAAGLSRKSLADEIGMSLARYRRLEIGATRRDPSEGAVAHIARVLAVPVVTVRRAIIAARL